MRENSLFRRIRVSRRALIATCLVFGSLTLGPAKGAPISLQVRAGTGASVFGFVPGGTAEMLFVTGGTASGEGASSQLACIKVSTSSGTDSGCSDAPRVDASEFDENLSTGRVEVSISSDLIPGSTLSANLSLNGSGSLNAQDPFTLLFTTKPDAGVSLTASLFRHAVPSLTESSITSTRVVGGVLEGGSSGTLFRGASAGSGASSRPSTKSVNRIPPGVDETAYYWDRMPSISANGRYVAYADYYMDQPCSQFITPHYCLGVLVYDGLTGRTTLGSVDSEGKPMIGTQGAISPDGRWVAFGADPQGVIKSGPSAFYLHDRVSGTTIGVLPRTETGEPVYGFPVAFSADFRYLALRSYDWDSGDCVAYIYDRVTGRAVLASVSPDGVPLNTSGCNDFSLSADGRYLAFTSTVLVNGPEYHGALLVYDRVTRATTWEVDEPPYPPYNYPGEIYGPSISTDGRYIAFSVTSHDAEGNSVATNVRVLDRVTRSESLVSMTSNGEPGGGWRPTISASGRYIAFLSGDPLVSGDTNEMSDVYILDRDSDNDGAFDERSPGSTSMERMTVSSGGEQANGHAYLNRPVISADGRFVAFTSSATNLDPPDINGTRVDVFVRDRGY